MHSCAGNGITYEEIEVYVMAKPIDLVIVRHGQSEANIIQRAEKRRVHHDQLEAVYKRPDFAQRLSELGREQALKAGEWLRSNQLHTSDFDERYVSPYYRTMETAALLGPECEWLPEVRLIERDWGIYGSTPMATREKKYIDTERMRKDSSFFVRFDNGESIADVVYRVRDFIGTLDREMGDKRVLAVSHGELMWAMRFVVERMLPQKWQELDKDQNWRIGNCYILWYSRRNPADPTDVRTSLSDGWRRIVNPVEGKSPEGGEWVKLPGKQHLSQQGLLDAISNYPPLIPVT
jgi:broad specificity phosphatase PhoE